MGAAVSAPALVVALDFATAVPALDLAGRLQGVVPWVKVGLELYLDAGRDLVARLKDMGFSVFLDLKFMDIPNTVQAAVAQGTRMGAGPESPAGPGCDRSDQHDPLGPGLEPRRDRSGLA